MLQISKFFTFFLIITLLCSCTTTQPSSHFEVIEEQLKALYLLPVEVQAEMVIEIMDVNPLFSHQIMKYLIKTKVVHNSTINIISQVKRLSIQKILASLKAVPVVITPLYHSASVTINSGELTSKYYLQYKEKGASAWLPQFSLNNDTNSGSFTTSIINLKENMSYVIRISQDAQFKGSELYQFTTNTKPIFSATNIYRLSDIYHGGVLDLVKLNIKGSKNNWVKIIGDDNTVISTSDEVESSINIGSNSYIYFENITINGGGRNAVSTNEAHHIWFNGCNISHWGREPRDVRDGKFYAKKGDNKPINYDSAFSLIKTGVVTIENCQVHSPRTKANSWKRGHPHGANAVLVDANHPIRDYKGQIVIRNNRFYGTDQHRFNDVIESRNNGSSYGGFVRDSAIYNNYLAYANDDIIEIDGSQSNVLIYNNDIEQGYCGISAIPNRQGPSYIFNNYIHNLGDQNNRSWAAIKLGGLVSRPAGKVNIFNNLIKTNSNGIASAKYSGDSTFWANVWSNIIIASQYKKNSYGYSVLEKSPFSENKYHNNFVFNSITKSSLIRVKDNRLFLENNHKHSFLNADNMDSQVTLPASYVVQSSITKILNNNDNIIIGLTSNN
jgi:hypothetical protein